MGQTLTLRRLSRSVARDEARHEVNRIVPVMEDEVDKRGDQVNLHVPNGRGFVTLRTVGEM